MTEGAVSDAQVEALRGAPRLLAVEWFASEASAREAAAAEAAARERVALLRVDGALLRAAVPEAAGAVAAVLAALAGGAAREAALRDELARVEAERAAAVRAAARLRADVRWTGGFVRREAFDVSFSVAARPRAVRVLQQAQDSACGAVAWEACFLLVSALLERYDGGTAAPGGAAVELGSGTALAGLVAHHLGFDVTLTDQPSALDIPTAAVAANPECTDVPVVPLAWGDPLPAELAARDTRLIIGSELIYTRDFSVYERLRDTIAALSNEKTTVLMCYEDRKCDERRFFDELMTPLFASVREINTAAFDYTREARIHVFELSGFRSSENPC